MCIAIKLIKWNLQRWYYNGHFHSRLLSLGWRCELLGRLQVEYVNTDIHRPDFPMCYIHNLSSHISHHFANAICPYSPLVLQSPFQSMATSSIITLKCCAIMLSAVYYNQSNYCSCFCSGQKLAVYSRWNDVQLHYLRPHLISST